MSKLMLIAVITALGLTGCKSTSDGHEEERVIPLAEVPAPVLAAAQSAVEGIVLTHADVEKKSGQLVYEVEGVAAGKEYEIKVSAEGTVVGVEEEDID